MADTDVIPTDEVSSKTESGIGNQYGSDMNSSSSYPQDLPTVGADCNGIKRDVDDDVDVNAGGGRDDEVPGGSYVFVSSDTDVVPNNKKEEEEEDLNADRSNLSNDDRPTVQVAKLDVDNGKIALSPVSDDHNCIVVVDGADVVVNSNQDEALPTKSQVPAEEPPNVTTLVLEPQPQQQQLLDDSALKVEDPIELHSNEESHIPVVESTADLEEGQQSIEATESLAANLKSDQPNNLVTIADLGQIENCQNVASEAAECKSSEVEVGEMKSEEPDKGSIPELGQSEKCQNLVLEAAECESSEVEVDRVKSEELTELKLAGERVECPESQTITSESVEYGLHQPVNGEVKFEEHTQLNSASEVVNCPEAQIISSESAESGLNQPYNGEEIPEVNINTDSVVDDSAREIKDNLNLQTTISNYFESGSYQLDHGEERVEEKKKADLDIDVDGNEVSKIEVTDIILADGVEKVDEETDVPLEARTACVTVSYGKQEVSETKASECIDSSNKCLKNELSENAENLPSLANCITSESELGDLPAESPLSFPVDPADDETIVEQEVGHGPPLITERILSCGAAENTKCETGVEKLDVEYTESALSCPACDVKQEIIVENDPVGDDEPLSSPAKYTTSETKLVFGSINPDEEVCTLESDDGPIESETSNGHIECVSSQSVSANCSDSDLHIYESLQNGSYADVKPESEVENGSGVSSRDSHTNDATTGSEILDLPAVNDETAPKSIPDIVDAKIVGDGVTYDKQIYHETEIIGGMHIDEIPASSAGSSSGNVQSAQKSVLETVDVQNGADRIGGGNGVTDRQAMEDSAELPTCLAGSSPVESAPNSVPDIVGVENGVVDQVNGTTDNKLLCQETNNNVEIHGEGIPPLGSGADVMMDGQNVDVEAVARPFHFLIRMPRFDDDKLKEQIRQAQLRVEEKTQRRDDIRMEIQIKRANCQAHGDMYEVAKSEERAARRLVRLKRQEIDSAQSVINKVKNAMSVEDIDSRIYNMEHMIEHETLPLKEEKQFIREIKQLRHLREQLSSNMGSRDEVQQAMDQKDEIEERLKILKKELDSLKDRVSKAEAASVAAGKKCDEESMKLREMQAQFRAADDIRQEAYTLFLSLKRQLFEKNKHFWMYKDDIKASNDYASRRDRVGLHHFCVNQVEKVMELWNKNDEFRREYVRCNMRSTVRRLRTLDGRSLGPDEEPPIIVTSYVNERVVDRSVSNPGKVNSVSLVTPPPLQQRKQGGSPVPSEEAEGSVGKSMEQKNQIAKIEKSVLGMGGLTTTVSGRGDGEAKETKREEEEKTKEEEELAKKKAAEEMTRKEELEAKLKEQRRLEEKVKAQDALERKKRNAEKAQSRAASKAQKEAEQKEKEREKRLKKKERKRTGTAEGGQDGGETGGLTSEMKATEASSKESETKENSGTNSKKAPVSSSYFRKQSKLKSIPPPPPPIRNRGSSKRRMQQAIWLLVVTVFVLALFVFGSNNFFLAIQVQQKNDN
ncbi:hypothetical protein LguiA_003531 [Lonicera macranthoides]